MARVPIVDVSVELPARPTKPIKHATFSADAKTLDVDREDSTEIERYDLATGAIVERHAAPPLAPLGSTISPEKAVDVEGVARQRLRAVAQEAGTTTREADGVIFLKTSASVGSDGRYFIWFESPAGTTLVRLDTGTRSTFKPWTNGISGMGGRTGGELALTLGPSPDRVVVSSISRMGAAADMDAPQLLDTRTMKFVGSLPGTCQPFRLAWSPGGAFIARVMCWDGRLTVSDGTTGALLRTDEALTTLAFSSDESLIAGRTPEGGLIVERTESGEHVFRLAGVKPRDATDVAFSGDGKRLIVGRGAEIDVWDLEGGMPRIVDTRTSGQGKLVLDDATTAVWIDDKWVSLTGHAPLEPRAELDVGAVDVQKLADEGETYQVKATLPRPGTDEILVTGHRTHRAEHPGGPGDTYVASRMAIVDRGTGAVLHVLEGGSAATGFFEESDWAWTRDGAHLLARRSDGLVILSPELTVERADAGPIPLPPWEPVSRLASAFADLDALVRGAQLLARKDLAPEDAPRAVHPSDRFVAYVDGSSVVVVEVLRGVKLRLTCADVDTRRGCLAATPDGRFTASPEIAALLVRNGNPLEDGALVKSFFAPIR
ncbi:MAG: WD40 repeat domain-containing protein [Polyangiaceae bacterium]